MGLLRFLLATSVVAAHAGSIFGTSMVPGNYAVETFYMISGFYMSFVLTGKYSGSGCIRKFYSNRYLRLYPTYLVLMLATWGWFFFCFIWLKHVPGNSWIEHYEKMGALPKAAIMFSNWTLCGLDLPSLFHYSAQGGFMPFHFYDARTAPDGAVWAGDFRTVSQAWTVGLEMWFYLIVPFLARWKSPRLLVLGLVSASLGVLMENHGLRTYFFFPAQLWHFIIGIMAERIWRANQVALRDSGMGRCVVAVVAVATICFPFWQVAGQRWLYEAIVWCSLPVLFATTHAWKWDRWAGNLSYPVYLVHMLVLSMVSAITKVGEHPHLVLGCTLALSVALLVWVETPLDAWRQRRVGNS